MMVRSITITLEAATYLADQPVTVPNIPVLNTTKKPKMDSKMYPFYNLCGHQCTREHFVLLQQSDTLYITVRVFILCI